MQIYNKFMKNDNLFYDIFIFSLFSNQLKKSFSSILSVKNIFIAYQSLHAKYLGVFLGAVEHPCLFLNLFFLGVLPDLPVTFALGSPQ